MVFKKVIYLVSFLFFVFFNGLNSIIQIDSSNLFIPLYAKNVKLFHDGKDFIIEKDGEFLPVSNDCIDKELRNLSKEKLEFILGLRVKIEIDGKELLLVKISPKLTKKLILESEEFVQFNLEDSEKIVSQLPASRYIQIFQFSNGEYGLHLKTRLVGGGAWGAIIGVVTGKFIVHAVGGVVAGAAGLGATLIAGPVAGWAVAAGTWGVIAPTVEATSTAVALATGIAGAVATGPV